SGPFILSALDVNRVILVLRVNYVGWFVQDAAVGAIAPELSVDRSGHRPGEPPAGVLAFRVRTPPSATGLGRHFLHIPTSVDSSVQPLPSGWVAEFARSDHDRDVRV